MTVPCQARCAPTIPPARVIELWDSVAEANLTLRDTLLEFARLILAEAARRQP